MSIEEGKKWEKFVLAHTSIEERLVPPEEVLKNYSLKDIQRGYFKALDFSCQSPIKTIFSL